ncbi:hypothetical protein ABZV31_19030 [Streptomyces sp. NPDC005202]|uniref:hypothetical protein n=1 Tax=Streptomyces sp. NPDC005202 TaxID=3157021 RepID=UPI00339F494E
MKSLKAAAVVAGSVIIAGVAAPAFAQTATDLNGAVKALTKPLRQTDALNTKKKDSLLNTVKAPTSALNSSNQMLGGLPLQN